MPRVDEIETCIVCHNVDCHSHGSVEIGDEIARRLAEAGSPVVVKPYICFGACTHAPNIVLYPAGIWYSGATLADASAIAAHILGGEPVEHLSEQIDPALRNLILQILDSGLGRFEDLSSS